MVDGLLAYQAGPSDGALPRRNWIVPLSSLHLVGALQLEGGPVDSCWIVLAGAPASAYVAPLPRDVPAATLLEPLAAALGAPLVSGDVQAAGSSRVAWPAAVCGRPFVELEPRGAAWHPLAWLTGSSRPRFLAWVTAMVGEVRWAA